MYFNSLFLLLSLLPLYIYLPIALHFIPYPIQQTKNNVNYLQSFDVTYPLFSHLILTRMSWLQLRKSSLHFILSDNDNYDFDVNVRCCRYVDLVNDVIDYRCLRCVFCFRIKGKKRRILYKLLFIIFHQSYFLFLIT